MLKLRLKEPLRFHPRPERKFEPHYRREFAAALADEDYRSRGLDDELRLHLRLDLLKAKGLDVDPELLRNAYESTRQQLLAPVVTERTEAVAAAWSQPEAEALWERWWPARVRERDVPSYEAAKAALATTSALGVTYVKNGRDRLRSTPELIEAFSRLAVTTSRGAAIPPTLPIREYSSMTRLIKRLSEDGPLAVQQMCVDVVRTLADLFPAHHVGEWVSIDAQLVPAWVVQKSAKRGGVLDEGIEAYYRRRCPEAGYRVYGYDRDGIGDASDPSRRIARPKDCRGYMQLLLTDNATGVPLVGVLGDASRLFEPDGLRPLLLRLYDMWPDLPLRGVVGDKLYDVRPACLMCELEFGITPVFVRRPGHVERNVHLLRPEEHEKIQRVDGWGIAYCRQHNQPMRVESVARPKRDGLLPGEPANDRELHLRFACNAPTSCGRPVLRMSFDPSSLTRLPHHHLARRPKEFALRQALLAARNSSAESAHGSLQLGYGQGRKDGTRARVFDLATLETLHWLGYGTRALLLLLAHREHASRVVGHLAA
jgi:hypothetical protein